eukprot:3108644-Rhodomonas_salina.1
MPGDGAREGPGRRRRGTKRRLGKRKGYGVRGSNGVQGVPGGLWEGGKGGRVIVGLWEGEDRARAGWGWKLKCHDQTTTRIRESRPRRRHNCFPPRERLGRRECWEEFSCVGAGVLVHGM